MVALCRARDAGLLKLIFLYSCAAVDKTSRDIVLRAVPL